MATRFGRPRAGIPRSRSRSTFLRCNSPTAGSRSGSSEFWRKAAFPAERLVIEITESSLFADIDLARTIVTSLKNQGIRLALDDFGTGFSSLAHLRSLPFDIIKIDRSFVTNIHASARARPSSAPSDTGCVAPGAGLRRRHRERGILQGRRPARLRDRAGLVFRKPMQAEQARELLAARIRRGTAAAPARH